ncbi:twin-arginine translocase TatA/TatE family subunit [Nonlabens sp. Asnod3-A02]|uniref:twin-arginine translocase TatA/TatE family subunit n=1 Tax=Nonlabens sp. Asnod3-A02 TaxID=3160579 RepID=UPI00386E69F1
MLSNYILLGMPGVGTWVVIVVAILILFGGKKIPELMRGIGGGIKEFKDATKEENDVKKDDKTNLDR